ncbi:tetratricopeptide repeat protein [Leptospira biflexa]|uniref:tetratricopeptide repeat protein n=1 Tax=Leptospira biflexa TaxID=172 RepID=UPI0010838312|nr:tetratricopeptide repeat protein [Leptospira biflexa]TGM35029.1 tetratricopeptide repeat protein [Leptospira biflexa]TGM38538.1 tetratricopeptide repeat protein [Leptospira biflexa]
MSRFQKNTLLVFTLLTAIAYAPLYYSIKNVIKKESLPITLETPETVVFFSLGEFEPKGETFDRNTIRILKEMISFQLEQTTDAVYLGKHSELSSPKQNRSEMILSGTIQWEEKGVLFTPKLRYVESKSTVEGKSIFVLYEERGSLVLKIQTSLTNLLDETIRLNRLIKRNPIWSFVSEGQILSESEFVKLSEYDPKGSIENRKNFFQSINFKTDFSEWQRYLLRLEKQSEENLKEVWKEVGGNPSLSSFLSFTVAKKISEFYFYQAEYSKAIEFANAARREKEKSKLVFHSEYADTLSLIGKSVVLNGKKEEAIFYLTSAKKIYDTLGLSKDPMGIENSYFYGLTLYEVSQLELSAFELSGLQGNLSDIYQNIYLEYNLAHILYQMGRYEATISLLKDQKKKIFETSIPNFEIALQSLLLYGAAEYQMGNWSVAKSIWESIVFAKTTYAIDDTLVYRSALFNLSIIASQRKNSEQADSYYKQYVKLTPYGQIKPFPADTHFEIGKPIYPYTWVQPSSSLFSDLEEKTIRSYTGRYLFQTQDEEIRARTYENRLEDTNLFLDDLLNPNAYLSKSMMILRKSLFGDLKVFERGNQVVFLDIGPALNHPEYPGVTSQAVAKHFPKMEVVLWELPGEVDLFLKKVKPELKEKLYGFSNIRILSADGVGDFQTEYNDPNHWILRNRPIPNLKHKTIIIRAANSIDIYEPYTKISPHFMNLGKELKENPVLYFFNRSILLKPKGKEKFILIGNQSIRGFHHNFQSLDRNGEPPYSILPFSISDEVMP